MKKCTYNNQQTKTNKNKRYIYIYIPTQKLTHVQRGVKRKCEEERKKRRMRRKGKKDA